jgi:hypothetical protein
VAFYGEPIPWMPELKFSTAIKDFDRVVYLFESELYRVNRLQEVALLGEFPRRARAIFDMDGMYNPRIVLDDYDHNHVDDAQQAEWIEYYEALTDRVMKPTLAPQDNPRVRPLIFYGYDPALQIDPAQAPAKQYDILHVGHNWWRWKEVSEQLLPAFEQLRDRIGEIGFIGLWWDKPPAEGADAGPEAAFRCDPDAFRRLRIQNTDAGCRRAQPVEVDGDGLLVDDDLAPVRRVDTETGRVPLDPHDAVAVPDPVVDALVVDDQVGRAPSP